MFNIPDLFWLVVWAVVMGGAVIALFIAPQLVSWQNRRIIAKGKDDPMTKAEIKRTIVRERMVAVFLLLVAIANFMRYLNLVFP